jgi:CMP-N,N'-diacetyllegionaminic acid synthase
MIDGERVLAVIPARGGSKGVPGKNIRPAGGKPLIAWTIEAAQASRTIDRLVLSSDNAEIIRTAVELGCEAPFVRSAELSEDRAPVIEVVLDALRRCPGFEWMVLLQPTSPLRLAADIDGAVERCVALKAPSCVSVAEARETPYWMYTLDEGARLKPLVEDASHLCRQELPPAYLLNGAVYVARTDWITAGRAFISRETVAYEMPVERSLDIDTETDFALFEILLGTRNVPLSAAP